MLSFSLPCCKFPSKDNLFQFAVLQISLKGQSLWFGFFKFSFREFQMCHGRLTPSFLFLHLMIKRLKYGTCLQYVCLFISPVFAVAMTSTYPLHLGPVYTDAFLNQCVFQKLHSAKHIQDNAFLICIYVDELWKHIKKTMHFQAKGICVDGHLSIISSTNFLPPCWEQTLFWFWLEWRLNNELVVRFLLFLFLPVLRALLSDKVLIFTAGKLKLFALLYATCCKQKFFLRYKLCFCF